MTMMRKWLAVMGAMIGSMAMGLSFSLININLESIHQQFQASLIDIQWMINIYGIFIASFLVTMGRLGDIFGRKKIYLIGAVLFGISMLGAGLATTPGMLIAFMAIYGISGAILLPLSLSLLMECFSDGHNSTATSIWAASGGITLALGPLLGGVLLNYLSWRWVFLINVPFALLAFGLTLFFARESKSQGESKKIDWAGLILLIFTIGSFVLATVQSNIWHLNRVVIVYGSSIVCLLGLLFVEKRAEMPIIREELFRSRMFLFSCAGNFCMIAIFWSGIFLIPLYLQMVLGLDPLDAGYVMLAFSLPVALISPVIGYLYRSLGPKRLIAIGFCFFLISTILQLRYTPSTPIPFVAVATFFLGLGFSFVWTPTTTGAVSAISKNFAGIASGTFITIQEIGGNVGLAISGTAARFGSSFVSGFHSGIGALVVFSVLGLFLAFFIPSKPKTLVKLK